MKYILDLEEEQVESIVRQDLRWQLHHMLEENEELENALRIVLDFYTPVEKEEY